jgi:hypothetical protein
MILSQMVMYKNQKIFKGMTVTEVTGCEKYLIVGLEQRLSAE